MIHWRGPSEDIFTERADALVNPVNCLGVSGLALEFKRRYPWAQLAYERACRSGELQLGSVHVSTAHEAKDSRPFIIHFPTKHHWRDPSRLYEIDNGLIALRQALFLHRVSTVAVPALGCGNGGLRWKSVRPLLEEHLNRDGLKVVVFAPHDGPAICRVCGLLAQGCYGWKSDVPPAGLVKADLCPEHARTLKARTGTTVLRSYRTPARKPQGARA